VQWVTDPRLGPALRDKIACMAEASKENGGPGKVIIVAYSLGGLVTKYAANLYADGQPVANDIGYIIDIASPSGGIVLSPLGVLGTEAECLFGNLLNGCDIIPIAKAVSVEVNSPVNTLRAIPKSIPVFTIAGNVTTPGFDYFFDPLQLNGDDLFVSVESAIKDENKLANGLGGMFIFPCSGAGGTLFIDDVECDHFGLSHSTVVEMEVTRQINKFLSILPSPCPASAGICLGTHTGDVDGDGRPDEVGLTYAKGSCSFLGCEFTNLTIHVALANGDTINYPVPLSANPDTIRGPITNPKFVGLSDMDGDGKVEVILTYSGCEDGCDYWAYELVGGRMQRMPFYGSPQDHDGLQQAFKCSVNGGVYQVTTTYGFQAPGESHPAITYQSDGKGGMRYLSQHMVTIEQAKQEGLVGANCPD
jgi:hypothetical protein